MAERVFNLEQLARAARTRVVAWARAADDAAPAALVTWEALDEAGRQELRVMAEAVFEEIESQLVETPRQVLEQEADAQVLRLAAELTETPGEYVNEGGSDFCRAMARLTLAVCARRKLLKARRRNPLEG